MVLCLSHSVLARSAVPVAAFSCRAWVQAAQLHKKTHVADEVRRPDPGFGPHQHTARLNGLRAEDMPDPDLNRPGFTGGQNSRRIAHYGTDTKEEDREAVFP